MIEFALMAALAGPQQNIPPVRYTPPQPIYTPPSSQDSQDSQNSRPIAPVVVPPKPLQTPSPAPSSGGGTWKDKMWQRYKQQSGSN